MPNHMNDDADLEELYDKYQETLEDLMFPVMVYSVMVEDWEGVQRLYTFSDEESQNKYTDLLRASMNDLCIREVTLFESLVNYTHEDLEMFRVVH